MATSRFIFNLPSTCLLLFLSLGMSGVRGLEIIQSPESLSVSAGEELTLSCTLRGIGLPGGVKWHKGLDRNQPAVYSKKGESSPRVTRVVPGSLDDFSIIIKNVRPEDAGTYYCVKYRQRSGSPEIEETAGKGTVVSVIGKAYRMVDQPQDVVTVLTGESLKLECKVNFSTSQESVKWFLGNGPTRKVIYDNTVTPGRVIRTKKGCETDFTIVLHNVTDKDAGTYYCVMENSFTKNDDPESESGHGTQVIVQSIEKQVVVQPQDFVSVLTGESLKLECWVEGGLPSGPMKWFLGNGTDRKVIYEDTLAPGRVTRNQKSSATDFTIVIHNVTDKDAGTYYCGMEKRFKRNGGADWKIGNGTQVAVKSAELHNSNPIGLWIGLLLNKVVIALFLLYLFLRNGHSKMAPGQTAGNAGFSRAD